MAKVLIVKKVNFLHILLVTNMVVFIRANIKDLLVNHMNKLGEYKDSES